MFQIFSLLVITLSLLNAEMLISAGGYDVKEYKHYYAFKDGVQKPINVNITKVLSIKSKNTNAVSIWITKEWQEDWYDVKTTQEQIINKGYTPVFIFYWFGDDINVEYVKKYKKEYFRALKKFTKYLQKLHGQKIVVLNPEYNMAGTGQWKGMNKVFLKSYEILREDKQVVLGPCVGDFGDYKYTNEPQEWLEFDKSLNKAVKKADFIAFQEMRGLTRNSEKDILKTPKRAYNFAKYLYKKYKKPTFLAYLAISTYGKNGDTIQAEVYKGFMHYLPKMQREAKLFGFGTFHYFDYPGHIGYFNKAEEFFGVLRKNGKPKPSFKFYNKLH